MSLTVIIIIITCLVSIAAFRSETLMNKLILWPSIMNHPGELYRLLTAGFIHANYMHLGFNMITFYFFGDYLQRYFTLRFGGDTAVYVFLALYILGIIISCIPSWIKKRHNPNFRSLGASGGVAAIIFAMIYLAPWRKIYLFFAIGIPSIIFAVVYLIYTAYMAKTGKGHVNHDAHLWGSIFGLVFMAALDPTHGMRFLQALMHPHIF